MTGTLDHAPTLSVHRVSRKVSLRAHHLETTPRDWSMFNDVTADDLGKFGPSRLFAAARILLHGQVVFGMIGCLTMVYGTIHPGQVACALFGIVAIDLKHGPMMRSYSWLLTFLLVMDVTWHHFWAERLLRNYTGVREEHEMWWGLMVANTNKLCGFGMEMVAGTLRLVSLPVWFMLWNGDYLSGDGMGRATGYEMIGARGFADHGKIPGGF